RLRAVEQWLAYELLPEGHARSNNVNDSMISETPYARSSAYFDWAMHNWNSGLSSWLWEHAVGAYGLDLGEYSDKAATVLWNRPVAPVPPGDVLPLHRVWPGRGMYQVRSGWQSGASSDDVVFSLYSGKYEGGHAQEDQNQFTLYGYGERFAIDHGAGSIAKESEAHNLVLIDGEGQHNAGQSIGTDGALSAYLLGDMADWVEGDASRAYTTFSEYNLPDHPVDGADWSWGYRGANPVLSAKRRVLAVHGGGVPYVYIMDDIQKDNLAHHYRWRMHTLASNTVDTATQPFCIHGATGALDVHLLRPGDAAVSVGTFDNRTGEPDAKVLEVACDAVAPAFALLMLPRPVDVPALPVARADYPWGFACSVAWPDGRSDCMVRNDTGDRVTHGDIETDALVTLVRRDSGGVTGFLVADASFMAIDGVPQVIVTDGRMGCELSGSTLHIDRYDVQFQVRDRGVTQLLYRAQEFGFVAVDGYVMRAGATAVGDTPAPMAGLDVTAYPNPFNPVVTVRVDGAASPHTRVVVYDIRGRRVRTLWNAPLRDTSRSLRWDGRNDAGAPVASGVYLVEVSTPSASRTIKLSLLK
ncbi:MAG TPA: FlgD immunoglobulin-like domain containing protein, partial [Candidatus Krumholzibacteria bacterium]|nr:FlgD immunoglobulin-like domain containing protein [Candidatus Krumholzibacteria bacterium]